MAKVIDIISDKVVQVSPDADVIDIAYKMAVSSNGVVSVCKNGKFRGVITEGDIVSSIGNVLSPSPKAKALMNNHLPIVSSGDDISHAASLMVNHSTRVLPVVQNGMLLGLLTLEDIAREIPALAAMIFCKTIRTGAA
jgi:CBS domain-containing protein